MIHILTTLKMNNQKLNFTVSEAPFWINLHQTTRGLKFGRPVRLVLFSVRIRQILEILNHAQKKHTKQTMQLGSLSCFIPQMSIFSLLECQRL